MMIPFLSLRRLRVVKGAKPVYDQQFHDGINIIRGENGSGKSTIADFIFYILGGEFEKWKTAAESCDEVQAEIETANGFLTLSRAVERAQTPIRVFFGRMADAQQHGLDGWERLPIRRSESSRSFSQVMFGACQIPEAKSQGASNITMHQMLRLLYADQRTPASFLFRFEAFDTREIREAVGDLVCGLSVYEMYELELVIREMDKRYDDADRRYTAVLSSLPREAAVASISSLEQRAQEFSSELKQLHRDIEVVDQQVTAAEVKAFDVARGKAADKVRALRNDLARSEERANVIEHELNDLLGFTTYLDEMADKLRRTEKAADVVGSIDFTHCPACLQPLSADHGPETCVLCGSARDPASERSRYLQIQLDLDIQLRESSHLRSEKENALTATNIETRRLKSSYQTSLSDYAVRFDHSISPRESYLAERYQRIGQIDGELKELERLRERVLELDRLSAEKAELQRELERRKDRLKALTVAGSGRRNKALTEVSEKGKQMLRLDLDRQAEFRSVQSFSLKFGDNAILVDGDLNFAESSNVVVKNTAIVALLLAGCSDREFNHPKFILLDNIEDKGMEESRSHNYQKLLVNASKALPVRHQVIMTTSKIDPSLEIDAFVIGPRYTHDRRTLDF